MSTPDLANNEEPTNNSRKSTKLWRVVLSILSMAVLIYIGWPYRGELHKLWKADLGYLAAVVATSMVTRSLTAEVFRQTVAGVGCILPHMEAFWLMILRAYSSLFIPRSGFGATGIYLKKRFGLRYASYTALLLPIGIVQIAVIGMLGLVSMGLLSFAEGVKTPPGILLLFAGSGLFAGALLVVRFRLPESWTGRLAHFLRGFTESWHQLSSNRALLLKLVALHAAGIVGRSFRLYLVFWSLGVTTDFLGVLVASLIADLAFIVSITPAGLGFREAAIVFGASLTGATKEEALAAAFLDRLVMIVTLVILAQIGLWKMPGILRNESTDR